ncbi:OmpA family protein [Haliscomenobacter hydrossis]|uniref:OmpA/MotB domain protein n=1 Tax=Haliscomenobacter hydrossis (strain ATCC 27775 / DSM 1100 / LMG 10767 / O) TaxID=760192 RepID=F4KW63_HALH1|nr:OmpA family protein [Haliscomenobacter hydrossis]AEE49251.1 OmpA/MotB domain protein [Haliscomenobacter hydrossis DSM 1100]
MRHKLTLLFFIGFSFFALCGLKGQPSSLVMAAQFTKEGDIAFTEKKYNKAIKLYKQALTISDSLHAARRGMAAAFEQTGNFQQALTAYLKVIEMSPKFSRAVYYEVGQLYYKMGQKMRAVTYFQQFQRLQLLDALSFTTNGLHEQNLESGYLEKLPNNIRACTVSQDTNVLLKDVSIFNLGSNINDKHDQYFPCLTNDQSLLFYTRMSATGRDEDLYYSIREVNGWRRGDAVGNTFNTKLDEGMSTLVRDGRRMFFTACKREDVIGVCDIWEAQIEGHEIREVKPIQGHPNSEKWESQAAISCDGRTLYFSSIREGGLGGADIWYSNKMLDGNWSAPKNMGPNINTAEDEESPFISNDGRTLFFTSTGHLSLGDQDIFMSFLNEKGVWGLPTNLGPEINSPFTERCFFLSADGRTGYFASNRPEGFGGMDIYQVKFKDPLYSEPMTFVEGFVKDSLSEKPLQTIVKIADRESIQTDKDGRFFICLSSNSLLHTEASVEGYLSYNRNFNIPIWDNKRFYSLELRLQPINVTAPVDSDKPKKTKVIEEDSVKTNMKVRKTQRYTKSFLFKFDSDEMEFNEQDKLDAFVATIAGKDIQRIEIDGYADDIGDNGYNLELSEKRAKKIALYLVDKGYPVTRIALKGYGEITDESLKKLNRKVELKIITLE